MMKQISYEFDWMAIAGALVGSQHIEDGFWQLLVNTECVTIPLPQPVVDARNEILPGHIVRITGLQLRKSPVLGFMCVEVHNGQIVGVSNATNTDQCRPEESGGGLGGDSRVASTSCPSPAAVEPNAFDSR